MIINNPRFCFLLSIPSLNSLFTRQYEYPMKLPYIRKSVIQRRWRNAHNVRFPFIDHHAFLLKDFEYFVQQPGLKKNAELGAARGWV